MPRSSSKKRKSNPFEESHTPSKKQRNQQNVTEKSSITDPSTADETPFKVECPARKNGKKGARRLSKDDVFGPEKEDGGFPRLAIQYAIRPGKTWSSLKRYGNFSIQNQKFSTGSLVYINTHTPPPEPPDSDASEAEILAFDKEHHWVGKVLEVKAASPSEVWLRVFWLYWPEELPQGRQAYHGSQELVMSNHMEIVDAKTVTSGADVKHWDEKIEDQDVGNRFWRQFYDVQQQKTKTGGLSTIRRHCICNGYYNPDKTMLKCPNPKCGIWNHQECLQEAILEHTYRRLVDGEPSKEKTKPFPASKITELKSSAKVESNEQNGQKPKDTPTKVSKSKHLVKHSKPWNGLLKADISVGDQGGNGAVVTITDERAQDPEVWDEPIHCLKCGTDIE